MNKKTSPNARAIDMNRRQWLKTSGTALAGALGAASLGSLMLGARPAYAAGLQGAGLRLPVRRQRRPEHHRADRTPRATTSTPRFAPDWRCRRRACCRLAGSDFGLHPGAGGARARLGRRQARTGVQRRPAVCAVDQGAVPRRRGRQRPDPRQPVFALRPAGAVGNRHHRFAGAHRLGRSRAARCWRRSTRSSSLGGNGRFGLESLRTAAGAARTGCHVRRLRHLARGPDVCTQPTAQGGARLPCTPTRRT